MYRPMFDRQKRIPSLIMAIYLLYVLIGIISKVSLAQDLCKTCKPFPDEDRRDQLYKLGALEYPISDEYIDEETWYCSRMDLAKTAPGISQCGTLFPIWAKEELVDDNRIFNVTVCAQIPGHICHESFVIKAKLCGMYKSYNLKQTAADAAYCLGAVTNSPVPGPLHEPIVRPILTTVNRKLVFLCNFNSSGENLFYKIYWYIDSRYMFTSEPHQLENRATNNALNQTMLNRTTVGFTLHCAVRASYQAESGYSSPVTSQGEYIGIKLYNTSVNLGNNPVKIFFKLTAPFECSSSRDCALHIELYDNNNRQDETCKQTKVISSQCGVYVKQSKWNTPHFITIKDRAFVGRPNTKSTTILKLTTANFYHHGLWANYRDFGHIVVKSNRDTSKIKHKLCSAACDPYITTFDQMMFSLQRKGIFTLYINVLLHVEVQVESAPCIRNKRAYCVCGVAVRAGRSVFAIQLCRPSHPPDFLFCNDADDVLDVRRKHEKYYEILIPSGAIVKVSIGTYRGGDHSMNVQIVPSVHDVDKSRGLCGKLSNTPTDDFVMRNGTLLTEQWMSFPEFSESWRVEDENSLFNRETFSKLAPWNSATQYCCCPKCQSGTCSEIECGPIHEAKNDNKRLPTNNVVSKKRRCSIHARRKRSIVGSKPNLHQMSVNKRAAPKLVNDWTRENATVFCEKQFDLSSSTKICREIGIVGITRNIEYCVMDILASGSTAFFGAALDSMQTHCMHELVMNSTFYQKLGGESIIDKFVKAACPYGCSMKGDCVDGVCRCHGNFSGSDCSVDLNFPPEIAQVEFEGLCDVNEDPCTAIALFGKTFVDSARTTCRFRHLDYGNPISLTTAHFESLLEVACPIPVHRSKRSALGATAEDKPRVFYVSVSNNGVVYSEEGIVVIYNSTCQTCTVSGTSVKCVTLEDYCTVGTQCIPEGGRYPFGECLVCDINGNERTWQEDPTCTSSCMGASAMWILTFPAFIVYYML